MTQEDKELLFKDLSARLPYGVKVQCGDYLFTFDKDHMGIGMLYLESPKIILSGCYYGEDIKPYLFPLSSMTEEQKNDCPIGETNLNIIKSNIGYGIIEIPWQLSYLFIEWCNKNHFDYRGLIPMDLAIDATDKNIY